MATAIILGPLRTDVNFYYPIRDLENDRIKLTPFEPSIHATPFHTYTSTDPSAFAHMPLGPFTSASDFTTTYFTPMVQKNPGMVLFAIYDKTHPSYPALTSEDFAGVISLLNTSSTNRSTEIGLVLTFPPFRRSHVTGNATGLLLHYCLDAPGLGGLGLRRVAWQTSSSNVPSQRAAERLGFVKEGVLRWDRVFAGGRSRGKEGSGRVVPAEAMEEWEGVPEWESAEDVGRDTVVYSIVWDEWRAGVRGSVGAIMDRR